MFSANDKSGEFSFDTGKQCDMNKQVATLHQQSREENKEEERGRDRSSDRA